ncbi:Hypothetical predicted protein [Paramuricea clavata]|uniref:Uncharacterized protein n=1 Tax=Paramuricea clavata TaxID=317549 RepID=A0A6S7G265_PARCT|nr:Hypothetical predicted protein [Paramuricea clavata]
MLNEEAGKFDYLSFSAIFLSKCHRQSLLSNLAKAPLEQVFINHLSWWKSENLLSLTLAAVLPKDLIYENNDVTAITRFYELSNETQKALFINVLSDDTIKRVNNLGQQDVQTLIESFQCQACGSSNIFVHEYEFHKRVQGSNESFDKFYNDLQTLLNKCQYKDCCQSSTRMLCKNRILLARLVAGDPDKKVTDESSKLGSVTKPTLIKVISADQELSVTSDVSVKAITIPSVDKHYYTDFILEWSYNIECGSIKTTGGHNLDVEARVLPKILRPPQNPTIFADQWFYIVHGEDGIILGTPACHALSVIDDDWPISTLLQNLNHLSSVNTLDASENNPQICDNKLTEVDHVVPNSSMSDDELLSDLKW